MQSEIPLAAVPAAPSPALRILVSFPIACLIGALATDLAYARTADMMWADFSAWLLAAGVVMGVLAAIAGVVHLAANRRAAAPRPVWQLALGGLVVLVLAALNNLFHSRDGWTSVVPFGLALSALTVAVILATAWLGAGRAYRRVAGPQHAGVR